MKDLFLQKKDSLSNNLIMTLLFQENIEETKDIEDNELFDLCFNIIINFLDMIK